MRIVTLLSVVVLESLTCSPSNAALLVDSFDGETLRLTHDDIKQSGIAGFGFIQAAPEVLGEERGVAMGSFSPHLLTDPSADVTLAVENGRLAVWSNYFVEGAKLQYGSSSNHLSLDLLDAGNSTIVVGFDYFDNFGAPDNPGMSVRVGAADLDGNFKHSSDPFFYAYSSVELLASDSPFEVTVPVSSLINQDPVIDLEIAATLIFDIYPNATDYSFAFDEIRIVPEPSSALLLALAATLTVLRTRRKRY